MMMSVSGLLDNVYIAVCQIIRKDDKISDMH